MCIGLRTQASNLNNMKIFTGRDSVFNTESLPLFYNRESNIFYYEKVNLKEAFNMTVKQKGYDIEQVVDVIEMLSYSQGFYGRLLEEILYIEENKPEQYEVFKRFIEKQEFQSPVDVVLFFEQ